MNEITKLIDQTFLKKDASQDELKTVAQEARDYGFRGFCVFPEHIKWAKEILKGGNTKLTALIDEPTGSGTH
jgi:deoxyribose-phosphate aldolase